MMTGGALEAQTMPIGQVPVGIWILAAVGLVTVVVLILGMVFFMGGLAEWMLMHDDED